MSKPLKKLRFGFLTFSFFDGLILIYPLYTLMFSDKGLSPGALTSILAAFSVATILFELPTGSLADRYSRRNVMLAGEFAKVLGFTIWLIWPGYWGFLIGIVLWALKISLVSGAREALVYDELSVIKHKRSYTRVLGDMEAAGTVGTILAAVFASLLAHRGYQLILDLTIASSVFSLVGLLLLPISPRAQSLSETSHLKHILASLKKALKTPKILYVQLILGFVVGVATIEDYFGLFYKEHHFSNAQISLWIGLGYLFITAGNILAGRIRNGWSSMMLFCSLWSLALLAATLAPADLTPPLLSLVGLGMTAVYVLGLSKLQLVVKDNERATMTSVSSLLAELVALLVFATVYFTKNFASYTFSLRILGIAAVLVTFAVIASQKFSTGFSNKVST